MTTMAISDPSAEQSSEACLYGRPVSAGLARRLAEAAFGYMGLGPLYLVAAYQPVDHHDDPYNVTCFKNDLAEAEKLVAIRNTDPDAPRYSVFGPYETGSVAPPSAYTLAKVNLLVDGPDVVEECFPLRASDYDSLFWTRAAVEKFAVPYYSALYSPAFAAHVLKEYSEAKLAVLGHMPWSEYTVGAQGLRGPIPVIHFLDENSRWQRKLLAPDVTGEK